ncbi:MAG: hypothetical protein RLZZ352_1910 [Pseudomonadota bacterium]|jgi:nucleotide-binding universal stress UspA family protein
MLNILIPTDGSEAALLAVHHALRLVEHGLQARFVLVNVQESATLYEMVVAHDPDVLHSVSEQAGLDLMRPAQDLLEAAGHSVEAEVVTGDDAAQMLIEVAERYRCDAIILSARGMGSLRAALLGSVSHELLQHAPVPVTVVRATEAEEDLAADADGDAATDR